MSGDGGKSPTVTVAVDAMGGDFGAEEIVRGVAQLSLEAPHIQSLLVGDTRAIQAQLARARHDPERISVHHAEHVVRMDEKPAEALDEKPECSVAVAARLVAEGAADALVSAGNTGASVLACARHWKKIPGVRRAPLAAVYPTEIRRGEKDDPFSLILDVGATLDVSAEDLVSFALMGSAYAARISKNPRPRVALLSNGAEAGKGPPEIVEAHQLLTQSTELNFVGNVEGVDIPRGSADVIVCGGYVGNVVLKMLEGISETVMRLAGYAYKERLVWRLGLMLLSGGIHRLKEITDWEQYGGAPVLGFDHLFIKAHGRSRARAIHNAVKVAAKAQQAGLVREIEVALREFQERRAESPPAQPRA
ncbi:MAG TPA: phosphate acyltransferase PlsX [Polyangia bacterium]|nr:phosphate acyltransferase PlsX [Polyangia bacterium]